MNIIIKSPRPYENIWFEGIKDCMIDVIDYKKTRHGYDIKFKPIVGDYRLHIKNLISENNDIIRGFISDMVVQNNKLFE